MPSALSVSDLEKMGYYDNFHGHVSEIVPCCDTEDKLSLIPAACLPVYPRFLDFHMKPDVALSFCSSVFRYEEGKFSAVRQWEFIVREFVFIGSEDYVQTCLHNAKNEIVECFRKLKLPVNLEFAADYFTGDAQRLKVLQRIQIASQLKEEFVFQDNTDSFAIGSINYHLDHFSSKYGWDNGGLVVSGCIGVGLNRLMNAISVVNRDHD